MQRALTPFAWLHRDAAAEMLHQADDAAPLETGGMLLGYGSRNNAVITSIIGAGPEAAHESHRFEPDWNWQTERLAAAYEAAGRRVTYLGDWHTHPGGSTTISKTDRGTAVTIARHPPARCPRPVIAVVAGGDPWQFAFYQLSMTRTRRISMTAMHLVIFPSE